MAVYHNNDVEYEQHFPNDMIRQVCFISSIWLDLFLFQSPYNNVDFFHTSFQKGESPASNQHIV